MIIAGIDPSRTPGITILSEKTIIHVAQEKGLVVKPAHKGDQPNPALFNARYEDWLFSTLVAHRVDHLAYELPIPKGQIASQFEIHELTNYMKMYAEGLCARLGIGFHGVHIQSWRSFFLGKTSAPKAPEPPEHILPHRKKNWQAKWRTDWWKDEAIRRCQQIGLELKSHDAAESVGVAAWLHGRFFADSWLRANDLFSGEMTPRPQGTLSLKHKPFVTPKQEKTKAQIMAEAESLFNFNKSA